MKLSKRDLLKWIGGGSVAAGAHALAGSPHFPPSDPGVTELTPAPVSIDAMEGAFRFHQYDCIESEYFDRVRFAPGAYVRDSIEFFQTPLGMVCPYSMTLKDSGATNMNTSSYNGFNAPRSFFAREFLIGFGDMHEFDVRRLADYGWSFLLLDRYMVKGSAGIHARIGENERPVSFAYPPPKGLYIPPLAHFAARMNAAHGFQCVKEADGGKGIDVIFSMRGLEWRGVA